MTAGSATEFASAPFIALCQFFFSLMENRGVNLHFQALEYFKREDEYKGQFIQFPEVQERVATALGNEKRTGKSRRHPKIPPTPFSSPRKIATRRKKREELDSNDKV